MYDPTNQYGRVRHDDMMREITEFWRIELARRERGEHLRPAQPRKTGPQKWIAQLITALHR